MEIAEVTPWEEYTRDVSAPRRLIAHIGDHSLRRMAEFVDVADTVVAIGPEGGFADDEVAESIAQGWQTVSLGRSVLRIETAAIAAASYFALASD
jgi:16S rRNA (uracil1498-N3)-methyltransferase